MKYIIILSRGKANLLTGEKGKWSKDRILTLPYRAKYIKYEVQGWTCLPFWPPRTASALAPPPHYRWPHPGQPHHNPGVEVNELKSSQELCQRGANQALYWLKENEQPIRSQISSLTQILTMTTSQKFPSQVNYIITVGDRLRNFLQVWGCFLCKGLWCLCVIWVFCFSLFVSLSLSHHSLCRFACLSSVSLNQFIYLSVCLSLSTFIGLPVSISVYLYLSICLSIFLPASVLFVYLTVYLSACLCLPVYLAVYLCLAVSIRLSVHLSG